jgi:hypothetical protein
MIWRIVRSRGFIPIVLISARWCIGDCIRGRPRQFRSGYVGDRDVILWNTLAQVRESVGEVHYGDRVEVVRVEGTASQVRTASGTVGWMRDSRQIMDSELWGKAPRCSSARARLPVQARGRTKTVSNVRVEPGRDGKRIFQFGRGTRVLILERAVADSRPADRGKFAGRKTFRRRGAGSLRSRKTGCSSCVPGFSPAAIATLASKWSRRPVKPATSDAVSGGPASRSPSRPVASAGREAPSPVGCCTVRRARFAGSREGLCQLRRPACRGVVRTESRAGRLRRRSAAIPGRGNARRRRRGLRFTIRCASTPGA